MRDRALAQRDHSVAATGAQAELDRSLQRLKTDHFELYQLHVMSTAKEVEQVFEITVNLDEVTPAQAGLRAAFHARHRALFTYDLPEEEVVLVTARAAASGLLPRTSTIAA